MVFEQCPCFQPTCIHACWLLISGSFLPQSLFYNWWFAHSCESTSEGVPHLREDETPPQGGRPGWAGVPNPRIGPWFRLRQKVAAAQGLVPEFEVRCFLDAFSISESTDFNTDCFSRLHLKLLSTDHHEATHHGRCVRPADLLLACQVCVQTSTSAGLDQILPWLFYHKVIGITHFLLFVEGKAAKPSVAGVLESIPVRSSLEISKNPVVPISLSLFSISDSVSLLLL